MNFLHGCFFLLLSMLITYFYLVAFFACLLAGSFVVAYLKRRGKDQALKPAWRKIGRKGIIFLGVVVIVAHIVAYINLRIEWMGDDNANFEAKEYFVPGLVVQGIRIAGTTFLHPENMLLRPYNSLQEWIHEEGVKYLPFDDGEIGVWTDIWFVYPYFRRGYKPRGTSITEPSIGMRTLLDKMWLSLETMATRSYRDKQIEREQYALNFSRAALHYHLRSGYYDDQFLGSGKRILKSARHVRRAEALYVWLEKLRSYWQREKIYEQIKRDMPKIEVSRQVVSIMAVRDIIEASIFTHKFSCQDPYVSIYTEGRREFADPKSSNYAWGTLWEKERKQAEILYELTIDSPSSVFMKYVLIKYCSLEIPGEEQFFSFRDKDFERRMAVDRIKSLFEEQLNILDEVCHVR